MESATLVQILDSAVCISFHANALKKDMNLSLLLQGSLTLICQPVSKKDNSEFKPVKLSLKIYLVPHPAEIVITYNVTVCLFFKNLWI